VVFPLKRFRAGVVMGLETDQPLPYEFLETPDGCIVRLRDYRRRFRVAPLLGLAFFAALFYTPLVAAAVFLAGQLFQAPGPLLTLAGLFVGQVASVGPVPLVLRFLGQECRDLAEQLHGHISRSQPSLPPVAVIDKPAAAVRAEWEALGREARAVLEGPVPLMWWQRRLWLRAALLLTSLAGLGALLSLLWGDGVEGRWKLVGVGCVFVEVFVVYVEFAGRAKPRVPSPRRPPGG
jgi:hypothetical protein